MEFVPEQLSFFQNCGINEEQQKQEIEDKKKEIEKLNEINLQQAKQIEEEKNELALLRETQKDLKFKNIECEEKDKKIDELMNEIAYLKEENNKIKEVKKQTEEKKKSGFDTGFN